MPSPRPRRARRWLVASAVLLLPAVVAAVLLLHSPGNVSHPDISFTQPRTTTVSRPPAKPRLDTFLWPVYGYDDARTRDFAADSVLKPPFRRGWRFGGNALIEFPPVIYGHTLYFMDDGATAKAISTVTGKQLWATHLGTLSAASPAIALRQRLIIVPLLSVHGSTPGGGRVAALRMSNGSVAWSRSLGPGSESSPVVSGHSVYFGDQAGTVFALDVRNGKVEWRYHASGAVKGGLAFVHGILYFGDYAGRVYAIRARDGHAVWAVSTNGSQFGFGSGSFYATPAVAFGRVYLGNTDGFVYSFAAGTGQLAWSVGTGAYVYSSASVADVPGLGPTVFVGSYNGYLYAFNARSGQVRWRHYAGGRISGSSTVVGDVVYFSDLGSKRTTGLDARTGRTVFTFPDGAFTPVIADAEHVYLCGYNTLYELVPERRAEHRHQPPARSRSGKRHSRSRKRHPSSRRRGSRARKRRSRSRA